MPIRNLDPDDDYQYDRTNVPPSRRKPSFVKEIEARAKQCKQFEQHPKVMLYGVCVNCNGPRYAHTKDALKNRKLVTP